MKTSSQYSNADTKLRPRRNDVSNNLNLSYAFPLPASSLDLQIPRVLLPLIPNNDIYKKSLGSIHNDRQLVVMLFPSTELPLHWHAIQ